MKIKFNKHLFIEEWVYGRDCIRKIEVHNGFILEGYELRMTTGALPPHHATMEMNKDYTHRVYDFKSSDFEVIND